MAKNKIGAKAAASRKSNAASEAEMDKVFGTDEAPATGDLTTPAGRRAAKKAKEAKPKKERKPAKPKQMSMDELEAKYPKHTFVKDSLRMNGLKQMVTIKTHALGANFKPDMDKLDGNTRDVNTSDLFQVWMTVENTHLARNARRRKPEGGRRAKKDAAKA
jgi:hypothetical protein